jgi:hypothetical protein
MGQWAVVEQVDFVQLLLQQVAVPRQLSAHKRNLLGITPINLKRTRTTTEVSSFSLLNDFISTLYKARMGPTLLDGSREGERKLISA